MGDKWEGQGEISYSCELWEWERGHGGGTSGKEKGRYITGVSCGKGRRDVEIEKIERTTERAACSPIRESRA